MGTSDMAPCSFDGTPNFNKKIPDRTSIGQGFSLTVYRAGYSFGTMRMLSKKFSYCGTGTPGFFE